MLWFDGSTKSAVDKVKTSGVVLLVFVKGDDSLSEKYESFLNKETKFNSLDYVAIKILHNSVAHKQFKQIYVNVPVPSVFIIGNNGKPLNIISSDQTFDIFTALMDAIEKQTNTQSNSIEKEESPTDITSVSSKKSLEEPTSKSSQYVRRVGYKLFDVSEDEVKERLREIRAFPRFFLLEEVTTSPPPHPVSTYSARIQFRLPNATPSWEFPDKATLADVKAYLIEKANLNPDFKLLKTFPRTVFTSKDDRKTLVELSLTPNATLIVIPVDDKSVQAKIKKLVIQENFVFTMLKAFLQPIFFICDYIKRHIFKQENTNKIKRLVSDPDVGRSIHKKTSTSNIHGFNFENESDSENDHPDNGNSTQQRYFK